MADYNNIFNYNNIFGSNSIFNNSNSIFDSNFDYSSLFNSKEENLILGIPKAYTLFAKMLAQEALLNLKSYKNTKLLGDTKNINLHDFYSKNSGIINSAVSMGSEAIKASGPERNLNGTTKTLNGVYDGASNVLLSSGNPWGMLIGGLMKAGSALTDVTSGLRKATDGMTTVDSILESDFFALTPTGLVNSIFGKNSKTFGANKDNEALLGNYLGHALNRKWALDHSNKRYGYFSSGSRRRDDRKIAKYLGHEDTLSGITKEVQQQNDIVNSMYDYASIQRHNKMHGGPGLMQIGKSGLKLDEKILKIKNRKKDFTPKFNPVAINVIFKRPDRTLDLLFAYATSKNPRFWQRIFESPKYLDFGNGNLESHLMLYTIDSQGNGYIYPRILEDDSGNLKDYDDMAFKRAILKGDYLEMNDSEINLFLNNYKNINPNFFTPIFLKGGSIIKDSSNNKIEETFQKNIIPNEDLFKEVYDYYKDYDLSNAILIRDNLAKTEGNKIYVNTDEDAIHELWHFLSQNKPNELYKEFYDNLNDQRILELGGDLQFINRTGDPNEFYNPSELEARIKAAKYKTQGLNYTKDFFKLLRNNPEKYGYNMRDLLYMYNDENLEKIFNLKKGGIIKESEVKLEETNQKNVIPEGALHKNKHHMDNAEDLTKKGIPVVDNDGELQAEIEKEELVLILEVTKTLEELKKIFDSEESTQKEKDLVAIEAGKLMVDLIINNTDDKVNLLKKLQNEIE